MTHLKKGKQINVKVQLVFYILKAPLEVLVYLILVCQYTTFVRTLVCQNSVKFNSTCVRQDGSVSLFGSKTHTLSKSSGRIKNAH